ncbi:prolipoprotein diacylglyceryl transferase [Clostridium massiliamazoniense]|uniref:prolipoprotein diacylglyceryl transferase n=1 Tax=Clostridium massiliamazoniense TaxID=1347366 RepID=UPI0006D7EC7A|nr:prolipoprotein diacylglyceryl transferase [Clostridium massiliamazoniense]
MDPIAFNFLGLDIRWYGIIIAIGIWVALTIAYVNSKKLKLDFDSILNIFLIAFPFAIIGARLYYVIFEFDNYKGNLVSILNIRNGGIAIHGALIGGICASIIYCKKKNINFLKYADLAMPSLIIAQGIGRWGNFFNQEAHGGIVSVDFISKFPKFIESGMNINGVYYHPTFLYESIWDFAIGIVLLFILYKFSKEYNGIVLAAYGILYSLGRFFIEGLRTDSLYFLGMRMAQLISLLIILMSIILLICIVKKKNRKGKYINN